MRPALALVALVPLATACGSGTRAPPVVAAPAAGHIRHVIVITRENRSFDS